MGRVLPPAGGGISIHAPREGGDLPRWLWTTTLPIFQSTPPARGATLSAKTEFQAIAISIHAPREGGDYYVISFRVVVEDFNPRPPRGGRPRLTKSPIPCTKFQSTPPARGATWLLRKVVRLFDKISIHAPREGGDSKDAQFYLRIFDK